MGHCWFLCFKNDFLSIQNDVTNRESQIEINKQSLNGHLKDKKASVETITEVEVQNSKSRVNTVTYNNTTTLQRLKTDPRFKVNTNNMSESENNKTFRSSEDSMYSNNMIDFDMNFQEYATNIFNVVINIRSKPQYYIDKLRDLYKRMKRDSENQIFIEMDYCTYFFKNTEHSIRSLEELFICYATEDEKQIENMQLVWSQNLFTACSDHLNLDKGDIELLAPRLTKACNKQTEFLTIVLDGIMDVESNVLIMLLENESIREDFFCKTFSIGAVCSVLINDDMKVRTILVLANYLVKDFYNKRKDIITSSFRSTNTNEEDKINSATEFFKRGESKKESRKDSKKDSRKHSKKDSKKEPKKDKDSKKESKKEKSTKINGI